MELKQFSHRELKAINNGKLPGFDDGHISPYKMVMESGGFANEQKDRIAGGVNVHPKDKDIINGLTTGQWDKPTPVVDYAQAIGAGASGLQNIVASFNGHQSTDEIMSEYKNVQANTAGIGWNKLVHAKDGKLPKYANGGISNILGATGGGAAAGSVFGPPGAFIGGALGFVGSTIGSIISEGKQKKNERIVERHVNDLNNASMNGAITQAMQIDNNNRYGDMLGQSLFNHSYANGKLPKYHEGLVSGEANAKVSNGEFIAREVIPGQFIGYRVPGLKNNKDGRLAHLEPEDYVISNKNGSSDIAANGDIIGAINHMIATGNPSYKCGKLPGHAEGWLGNGIPAIFGSLASLGQYLDAKNSTPYRPNTYASNPYETQALTTLAGLRINPYPITRQLRNAEARTNRAIDIAGGLSGSQRTAARLANLNTTQNNISNLLSNIQQQNNAYRSKYAEAALQAGQQARTARMQANQWDLDYYSKAHAARNRGIQTGIANMLSQIQQYQANEFKRRQFNDTMDLYRADQKQRNEQNAWMRNWYASQNASAQTRGIAPNPVKYDPVNPYTPIAPEPVKRYPWDYKDPQDYWKNLSKKGGLW